jgi:hypothetical protein
MTDVQFNGIDGARKGIPLDVVQRECRNLESAIRAEIWRRVLLPDDVA